MDAIKILRQRAADKRDQAVKAARDEFRKATRLLDQLAECVAPEPAQRQRRKNQPRPIVELIAEIMPKDRTFTIDEIVALLRKAQPDRTFNPASVRTLFPDLVRAGLIRKVRRAAGGYVHWAAAECEVDDDPIAAMTIADATELVLSETGPLTPTEIVVALKERGYRAGDDPRTLLTTLRYAFKRSRGRFRRGEDGRWEQASTQ